MKDSIDTESTLTPDQIEALLSLDKARVKAAVAEVSRADLIAHLRTEKGEEGLKQALEAMPSFYVPGQVDSDVTVRWNVNRQPSDAVEMDVIISSQECRAQPVHANVTPTVTIGIDAMSFLELASGIARGKNLMMQGNLKVKGNVQLAMRLEKIFGLGGEGDL